jgi:endonuclease/exonuclease/phosphatase (EEP) superfamily protein YafD
MADGGLARDVPRVARRKRWVLQVLLVAILGLHGLYLVGDRTWWAEYVAVWPPVGWLVLLAPAAWRARSVAAGLLLVLLVALHSEWPRLSHETSRADRLTVVSWNVSGTQEAWPILHELRPDLALVQESAGGPSPEWPGATWAGSYDPGTLSRFPMTVRATHKVGPWVEPQVMLVGLPRGRKLVVVNVRLVLPSVVTWVAGGFRGNPRVGHDARVAQYPALAELVRATMRDTGTRSALVCGDFNSPATLPSFRPLRALLEDAWETAGQGWPGTATADLPLARIDQCWSTPDLRAVSARSIRARVSDHRLLLVQYELQGQ